MKAHRLLRRLFISLLLLSARQALADNFVDGSPIPDYYDEPGFASFREQVASEDAAEAIDPFSGRLHISHVDIDIPGNGGLDLKVVRSYDNIQLTPTENNWGLVGVGWDLHFGRVLLNSHRGICDSTVSTSASDHVLQLPDGSRHVLYVPGTSAYSSYLYVTADRWIATCTTANDGVGQGLIVTSPDGVSYYMTQPYTGMGPGTALAATKIADRNGNTISISYESAGGTLGLKVISGVSTSDGRSLSFNYANLNATNIYLSSISTGGYTWQYQYQAVNDFVQPTWELTTVTRPDYSTWQYTYYPGTASIGGYSMQSMTYPHGAQANYSYQNVDFGYPYATVSVSTKSVSGPNMVSANWSYNFSPSASGDTTNINGPDITYTYKHVGYMQASNDSSLLWEVGNLLEKDVSGGGATQSDSYSWTSQLIATQPMAASGNSSAVYANGSYVPVMSQHVITRDGTSYTTAYSQFDNYGNAQSVTENGTAGTRSTSYSFHIDTSKWVIHEVGSQTISGIGTISNGFDGNDNITSTNKYGVTTNYGRTSAGDISSVQNARGYTTNYSSYMCGIAQTISEPEGVNISKNVSSMGTVSSVRDGNGNTTRYSYDGLDRPTSISYPIHSDMSIGWNTNSISATRGGYSETTTLDGLGRPVNINHSGINVSYEYDALGHKIFESYPCSSSCGSGRSFDVDALGRVTEVNNNGATRQFDYGGGGSVAVTTERNYHLNYVYQSYGNPDERFLTSLSTDSTSTSATYYANGLLHQISQGGYTRTYYYDSNWFLTGSSDPETGSTTFGRDAVGNLSSVQVGSAGATSYSYDGLNRKYSVSSSAPSSSTTGPVAAPATQIKYDDDSNVTNLNAGCVNITYNYDQLDELTSEEHQDICGGPDLTASYGYDNIDHLSSTTYPSGKTISYAPDVWGRPTTAGSYVNSASYWPNGAIQSITFGNGATESQALTSRQLVQTLLAKTRSGGAFASITYGYDDSNNVTSITDSINSANSLNPLHYDGDDQLTSVSGGAFQGGGAQYDGLGNIKTLSLGNGGSYSFGYSNNRLTSVSGSKNYTVNYDAQGNATSDAGYQYIYDTENRIVSVSIVAQGNALVRKGLKH